MPRCLSVNRSVKVLKPDTANGPYSNSACILFLFFKEEKKSLLHVRVPVYTSHYKYNKAQIFTVYADDMATSRSYGAPASYALSL